MIYGITDVGALVAVDARNGLLLMERPVSIDAGLRSCIGTGAGVANARNTVYAPCDAAVVTTGDEELPAVVPERTDRFLGLDTTRS